MKTLAELMEWVEARAYRKDECLVWKFSFNGNQPQGGWKDPETGRKVTINVRRWLWERKVGRGAKRAYVVVCKCGTDGCVEPSHLTEISRSAMLSGKTITPSHRLAITLSARRRSTSKLTEEAVQDIRYGDGTQDEKAERHGVTRSHVQKIMAHQWWRDLSSPFMGLMR